jgi:hypothetical protein
MPHQKSDIEATDPGLSISSNSSKTDFDTTRHAEHLHHHGSVASATRKASVAAKLRNPLTGFTEEQV